MKRTADPLNQFGDEFDKIITTPHDKGEVVDLLLPEDRRRWVVTGIALQHVVAPLLRDYVGAEVFKIYNKLKKTHQLDKQTSTNKISQYRGKQLEYKNINTNAQHKGRTQNYDYQIKNHVDFSKLFMQTHMAKFTIFDESCDPSALLGLLINIADFPPIIQTNAEQLRKLRNDWAHCNFNEWSEVKYLDAFANSEKFIRCLQLPTEKENKGISDIKQWQNDGVKFFSTPWVDVKLCERIQSNVKTLAKLTLDETGSLRTEISSLDSSMNSALRNFKERLETVERRQKEDTDWLKQELKNTSKTVKEFDQKVQTVDKNVELLEEGLKKVNIAQADVNLKVDKLNTRVGFVENKLSSPFLSTNPWFDAPDRNSNFLGRLQELGFIRSRLEGNSQFEIIGLCGLGGCGKSTIANEVAWLLKEFYSGVFWISAESSEIFENSVNRIALELQVHGDNFKQKLDATIKWFKGIETPWLCIVDNLELRELSTGMKTLLMGSWRRGSKGHIIVTTRREPVELQQDINIGESACLPVGPFTMEESIAFMVRRAGYESDEHLEVLLEELGFLPLALEQAAVHIKQRKYSYEIYLSEFQQRRLKWLKKQATAPHVDTLKERLAVKMTWNMNFEYIKAISEEEDMGNTASTIMKVMAFMHADDVPIEAINEGDPPIGDEDLCLNLSSCVSIEEAMSVLTKFSLFTKCSENSLSVHRLVQEVIRDHLTANKEYGQILQIAVSMLNKALKDTDSPIPMLTGMSKKAANGVSLCLWSRLGLQACSLRNHVKEYNSKNNTKNEMLISESVLRIFYESSIFHSVNQRQSEALCAQGEKNTMMTYIDSLDQDMIELYMEIKIPILEDQRKCIEACTKSYSSPIKDQNKADELQLLGNAKFNNGNFHAAISCYSEAINVAEQETPNLFSNRSLNFLRIEEYEKCLNDANHCLSLDFDFWKANCWKAYALYNLWNFETKESTGALQPIPNLLQTSDLKNMYTRCFTRSMGYAAAAMATYQHPESTLEYRMKIYYPVINYCVVHDTESLHNAWLPTNRPYTTIFLQPNTYTTPLATMQSTQMVGLSKTGVTIVVQPGKIENSSDCVRNIHFENLTFKGHDIVISGGEVASFMNCFFANGMEACDEFPFCKGGNGCKFLSANECLRKSKLRRSGELTQGEFLEVGKAGFPGLTAFKGGSVIVHNSHFNRCGGGGMLVDGHGSFGKIDGCIIERCRQQGLEVRNGGILQVSNCDIRNNQTHGIAIGPGAEYCEVDSNTVHHNLLEGILFSFSNTADIKNNTIFHNGMRGISAVGGIINILGNKIFENWFWGISLKSKSSANVQNNEIFSNKCGGIRNGINFSARVLIDGNNIHDHPGRAIHTEVLLPTKLTDAQIPNEDKPVMGIPQDEVTIYTTPPVVTNRNVIRKNGIGKPLKIDLWEICANCHSKEALKYCSKCRKTQYCSKSCQEQHWSKHKHICKVIVDEYSVVIKMKETQTAADQLGVTSCIRIFHHSLKGIGKGTPPNPDSTKKFIVKIQSGTEASLYDPETIIYLYDQTLQLDIRFVNPTLYHIVTECGVLGANQFTSKKVYLWANYEKKGEILRIHIDEFPPTPTW